MKTKKNIDLTKAVESSLESIKESINRTDKKAAAKLVNLILKSKKIFITGQGRSGLISQCFATRLTQIGFDVSVPGKPTCKRAAKGDLLIVVSCSGTTTIAKEIAKKSKKSGTKIAVITAISTSPLAKMSDLKILIPSNNKEVRKVTGAFIGPINNVTFEESVMLYLDALSLMILEKKGLPENLIIKNHTNLE